MLKALSLEFKDMGYCQGLNFIAATLLLYLNDEVCNLNFFTYDVKN